MNSYEDYLIEALETVIHHDVPDEVIHQAVVDQAKLMAGDVWTHEAAEDPYTLRHQFS